MFTLNKLALSLLIAALSTNARAMEAAPRISDREIIEALSEPKAGQRALAEQMDQRFDSLEKRLDFIQNLLLALIAGVFGLIDFVVWEGYSTLYPMDLRICRLEEDLERDLELKSPEGSRLTRLIHALRELAKTDPRIEAILNKRVSPALTAMGLPRRDSQRHTYREYLVWPEEIRYESEPCPVWRSIGGCFLACSGHSLSGLTAC